MITFKTFLIEKKAFSLKDAKRIGALLDVDWDKIDINQFAMGLSVESEHDDGGPLDVVKSEKDLAKIVLAHLKETPNYYTKLKQVEEEAPANSVAGGGVAGLTEPISYRKLQDRVDKLEADKESLVNHIYDLRQLLQKINADGESKLVYLKGKNLAMKTEIAQLLMALEISRQNSTHFAQVASYWSYCVNTTSYKTNNN